MLGRAVIAATALVASTWASSALSSLQQAIIIIEASHGGAGTDRTNTTIEVSLTSTYSNTSALAEVSTLYLVGAKNVPLDSLTCTPFKNADGSGTDGLSFNSTTPSRLSTNTVQVGSIVCTSDNITLRPPRPLSSLTPVSSASATVSSNLSVSVSSLPKSKHAKPTPLSGSKSAKVTTIAPHPVTSTFLTTASEQGGSAVQSTVTSVYMASASVSSEAPASTPAASAPSASASLSAQNSANSMSLSSEFFGGLALAGFGLAFVL